MDALKWLFKATIIVALAFLGLKAEPKKQKSDERASKPAAVLNLFSK